MASISAAILCDFAQVRENLLFVSSAGVTRVYSPTTPAAFNMMLALMLSVGPDELDQAHELSVVIKQNETARDVARLVGAFQSSGDTFPGEGLFIPLALDFRLLMVNDFGAYDVHTEVDGNVGPHLTCYIVEAPSKG